MKWLRIFFLPHPMSDVGKRLFPTFASGDTGFEFVSFPLLQTFHWDGLNLLKLEDRKQSSQLNQNKTMETSTWSAHLH